MSHTVELKTEARDPGGIAAACRRLGLSTPVHRTVKLFSSEATGLAVQLPGWHYPVVIDTASGEVRYDNFGGRWGEQKQFDAFLQAYAVEVVKAQSRRKKHTVTEQALEDGSIKLTVGVQGGAA